jgi:hypothetical protein
MSSPRKRGPMTTDPRYGITAQYVKTECMGPRFRGDDSRIYSIKNFSELRIGAKRLEDRVLRQL